jgi:mRNA interferase MazF
VGRVAPLRGRVYAATIDEKIGRKYYLVISNNQRNRQLGSVLGVRLATTPMPEIDTIIECGDGDPVAGRILCDDIVEIFRDEIARDLGAVTPATMRRVDDGLRAALSLR